MFRLKVWISRIKRDPHKDVKVSAYTKVCSDLGFGTRVVLDLTKGCENQDIKLRLIISHPCSEGTAKRDSKPGNCQRKNQRVRKGTFLKNLNQHRDL